MIDLKLLNDTQKAALLIKKGLNPRILASTSDQSEDYSMLLSYYRASHDFRSLVSDLALMLDIRVIDALENTIILTPTDQDSPFAFTLSDMRANLGEMERGAIALIHIAIAAAFYPTAERLTEFPDDQGEITATPYRIATLLQEQCQILKDAAGAEDDPELDSAGLNEAWRSLLRLPITKPSKTSTVKQPRASLTSLVGMVKTVLNFLQHNGMVNQLSKSKMADDSDYVDYVPTPRYRIQVKDYAANAVFAHCADILYEARKEQDPQ